MFTSSNGIKPVSIRPNATENPMPVERKTVGKHSAKVGQAETQVPVAQKLTRRKAANTASAFPASVASTHAQHLKRGENVEKRNCDFMPHPAQQRCHQRTTSQCTDIANRETPRNVRLGNVNARRDNQRQEGENAVVAGRLRKIQQRTQDEPPRMMADEQAELLEKAGVLW